ncbi:MAG: hypothetical protein NWQ46_03420 [Spirosomaceae bacterium]|nr:hypothetical protein [Spirosomataceae bacterium]
MTAKSANYKESILSKISNLPEEKLALVDEYLEKIIEQENEHASVLSYAGIFKNLDSEVLDDLTVGLPKNRIAVTCGLLTADI